MELITKLEQLIENIEKVEYYLTEGTEDEISNTHDLIKRGTCFIAYSTGPEIRFAPSRFLGYERNHLEKHGSSRKDGRETNKAIAEILQSKPTSSTKYEQLYLEYCKALGIHPNATGSFGVHRKFWPLQLAHDFEENQDLAGEFPEGKLVERTHKARERNSSVIQLAKENYKRKHGRLFCQVCGFDFETKYGDLGKDFIEGHHTIPVSEMSPSHKTKQEDIAMLCSNCHRMVHKRRPWLTMEKLTELCSKCSSS